MKPSKKRIVVPIWRFGEKFGGVETQLLVLLSRLKSIFQFSIFTTQVSGGPYDVDIQVDVPVSWLEKFLLKIRRIGIFGTERLRFIVSVWKRYRQLMSKTTSADIVFAPFYSFDQALTVASVLVARRRGCLLVLELFAHHSVCFDQTEAKRIWEHSVLKWIYQNSDVITVANEASKKWLAQFAPVERIRVIPCAPFFPPLTNETNSKLPCNIKKPFILFLGRKQPYKGYSLILKAAEQVWRHFPDVQFVFAGENTPESLEEFKLISDSRLINLDWVSHELKALLLRECELLCLPSNAEAFGVVFAEAWSYNKPVIGPKLDLVREVVDDGVNGLLIDLTPEAVAKAIETMLRDPKLKDEMGKNGFQKVTTMYSPDARSEKYLTLFNQVGDGKFRRRQFDGFGFLKLIFGRWK